MPRGAWLGLGAVGAALVSGVAGPGSIVVPLLAVAFAPIVALLVARHRPVAVTVLVGSFTVVLRLLASDISAPAAPPPPDASIDGAWVAQVVTLGSTADGKQRATLLVEAANRTAASHAQPVGPWRTYAWLPRYPAVIPTDRIEFDEVIEPVRADGSEFATYLASIDVVATVRIGEFRVAPAPIDAFGVAERVRGGADAAFARVLPEPMAGLASGILVGRRDRVSREVTDSFTITGLSHVVAISGWNICLVAAVIGGLLRAIGCARRTRTIAIVIALAGFTLLAGGGASVIRAALMGGVALVARETGRPGSAAAALGLAVWSLLALDPTMVDDVGFQLSVAATAGLLAWGSRLTQRLAGFTPGRARRWLADSMGVSLAAQAATLPLVLFHFGRLSLVSPIANLVIAPLVAPAMLVGAIALVAGLVVGAGLPFVVGAPFALLGWLVLGAMVAVSGVLAGVPFASVELPPMWAAVLAIALAVTVGTVTWRRRGVDPAEVRTPAPQGPPGTRRGAGPTASRQWPTLIRGRTAVVCAAMLVTVACLGAAFGARAGPGRLAVTVLDVGQGDAILVEGPRGGRMLLDSGPDPDRLLTVLDRHIPAWDRRLDLVILTHPHEDHVAGLAMLVERYRVAAIAENGMLGAGPGDAAFRGWLREARVRTQRLAAGDRLSLDGLPIVVRWPLRAEVPARSPSVGRAVNDTSIVLDLRYGHRRLLLTGDIEDDVDPRLLASGIGNGQPLDVLKVAHHGSRTATSDAWLDALSPRLAMVSAGTGNPYGHPAPETIGRLRAHGAKVLRTDLDGDLQVSTDGDDLRTSTSGGRPIAARQAVGAVARSGWATPSGRVAAGFLCAIPLPTAQIARVAAPAAPRPPRGRAMVPTAPRPPPHDVGVSLAGNWSRACYDHLDHGAHPRGRGRSLPVALALDRAAPTRLGRRRRGLVPRRRRAAGRARRRPVHRRGGGVAA